MDESLMPDWMKKSKEASELREARAANAAKDQVIAQMKVESGGPIFWKELIEKLGIQTGHLPEAFKKITGTVNVSDSQNGEIQCRLDVSLQDLVPKSAYVILFYRPGGVVIRCHPQIGTGKDLQFSYVDEKVILILDGKHCNPEQTASHLVQELVRQVAPEKL